MPEASIESIRCEAYGLGGAALIVDCTRGAVEQVRHVVLEHGGYMGARGSVGYLFNAVGRLVFAAGTDAAQLVKAALRAGAEEVVPGTLEVLTDPIDFDTVRVELQAAGLVPIIAQVTQRASIRVPLQGETAVAMLQLIEALKDLKDVENVYTNAEIPVEVLARV